jgi:hypothetical protein
MFIASTEANPSTAKNGASQQKLRKIREYDKTY